MKQKYLLDTCICAYWLRDKQNVRERINAVGMENCYISEITIAELKFGKALRSAEGRPEISGTTVLRFEQKCCLFPKNSELGSVFLGQSINNLYFCTQIKLMSLL
jgi:tRNA(fMet)-specific endonuclease VapC